MRRKILDTTVAAGTPLTYTPPPAATEMVVYVVPAATASLNCEYAHDAADLRALLAEDSTAMTGVTSATTVPKRTAIIHRPGVGLLKFTSTTAASRVVIYADEYQ